MVQEAIQSVLAQSYRPIEIIVVDDGSTDETPSLLDSMQIAHPGVIRVIRQDNAGPGAAREVGRLAASGEFIQYLDSDDLLLPEKFEVQVAALRANENCDIAYGMTHHSGVGQALQPVAFKRTGERFEKLLPAVLASRWWSTSTPLYRREFTDRMGPWLPTINEEDWEYDARAGRLGAHLAFCEVFVSVTRWHDQGRLNWGGSTDPRKLCDRARAHELILGHALAAGIATDTPEMKRFARSLFLLSRQCGLAGMADESRRLFELASQTAAGARSAEFTLYRLGARAFGWRTMGRVANWRDRLASWSHLTKTDHESA
jgi:glycosyltransferase involved in cell wall biosynthesis